VGEKDKVIVTLGSMTEASRDLTGNVPGEGGLITFPESSWLASIVLAHQPHFIGQPADVDVFWGYGLFVDNAGDFVKKPMSACTGREVMTEIMGHLRIETYSNKILETCACIPCMMPFITSQFLRRDESDRPQVIPEGAKNLAFIGQFCELPEDVVFTVEYSIRSAQTAVYSLLRLNRTPPAVYKGSYDLRVLLNAFLTLHDKNAGKTVSSVGLPGARRRRCLSRRRFAGFGGLADGAKAGHRINADAEEKRSDQVVAQS
jgi:oleate hydratase